MRLGLGLGVKNSGFVGGYDSATSAFLAATGITSKTESDAVNSLVLNLKSYGLWSKMKAIYPFVSDTVNLFNYSEDFTDGNWNKSAVTITGNVTNAPNGTNTADLIVPNTTSTNHIVFQAPSTFTTGISYTFSYYAKSESYTKTAIRIGGGGYATVPRAEINLTNGSIIYQQGFTALSVVSSESGWYRIIGTVTAGSGLTPNIQPLSDSYSVVAENYVYSGNGTSGIYIWGAQLELGSSATTYQQILTTPANRFVSQFKYNLKDPRDLDAAFRLAFNGTWTYSSTGALPNGTNAYADSFITPSANLNANSTHVSYYSRTNVTTNAGTEIGTWYSGYNYGIELNLYRSVAAQKTAAIINSGGGAAQINGGSITPTTGLLVGSRIANNNGFVSKNGATIGTNTTTVTTQLSTFKIYLGAANNFGTAGAYSNKESAFASIGDGITEAEATNLYTSVQQFNQDLSRQVGVPIVSDADAQSFLNAAQITDLTQANAINTLVVGLKNASLWTKMKAIYPFVGGTATSHKWNLKDPRDLDAAYRLAFFGAWTHSSTGALPNGTNAYADSFLIPSSALTLNNTAFGYYSRTNSSQSPSATEMAVGTSGTQLMYLRTKNSSGNAEGYSYNTNPATVSNANSQGFYIVSRTSNSDLRLYKNNSNIVSLLTTQTGTLPSNKFAIGAVNYGGTIGEYSNKECALAFIGDGINSTEATTLNTLVTNFETTLGRNV